MKHRAQLHKHFTRFLYKKRAFSPKIRSISRRSIGQQHSGRVFGQAGSFGSPARLQVE